MPLRITLSDEQPPASPVRATGPHAIPSAPPPSHQSKFVDWEDPKQPTLLLVLPTEPEPGMRFHYDGAEWEVVDYRDGWIARLVID